MEERGVRPLVGPLRAVEVDRRRARRRTRCRRACRRPGSEAAKPAAAHASRSTAARRRARARSSMYTSASSSPSAASPAAVASGLPASVPAWNTVPSGVSVSITSRRPPTAPIGRPPPITLPNVVRSGVTSYFAWAPPEPRRNPVITSSNTSRAPTRSHSARSPSRKPGAGRRHPCWRRPARRSRAATRSSSVGHHVVRHDERLGDRAGGHAGRAGQPERGDAAAAGGEQRVGGAVEVAVEDTIRSRPVKPRARRTAVLVASVPEFISRTCSQLATRSRSPRRASSPAASVRRTTCRRRRPLGSRR